MRQLTVLLLALCAASPLFSDDWPGLRGPDQRGSTEAPGLFEGNAVGLEVDWRVRSGSSYSSLTVSRGVLVTLSNDGVHNTAIALDAADGRQRWTATLGPLTAGHDGSDPGPSATPTISDDRVFVYDSDSTLYALDFESGAVAWKTHVQEATGGGTLPFYAHASSPLVIGDLVVVVRGTSEDGVLVALRRSDGKVAWIAAPGEADYQSAIAASVDGIEQIVFWENGALLGLDLEGRELWRFAAENGGEGTPLVVPTAATDASPEEGTRFLLLGGRSTQLVQVKTAGEGYSAEQLWISRKLKGSMGSLAVHEGTVYGFDRSFLTALDLESGETLWKSRPPGGSSLIAVEDRLVIFAADGEVVLAKASREGFLEEARASATERDSLTWPAFADGRIYVRDRDHIVALGVTDQANELTRRHEDPLRPGTAFTAFVERAAASPYPALQLEHWFRDQKAFPVREGNLVHFVYRADARDVEDVALSGSWTVDDADVSMARLGTTDFFYRTVELAPDQHYMYDFQVDFDRRHIDPVNPLTVPGRTGGRRSLLLPDDFSEPDWLRPYVGEQAGTIETWKLTSKALDDEREVTVYLPHAAHGGGDGARVVLTTRPEEWLALGQLHHTLDHLIGGGQLPPTVVALLPIDPQWWFLEEDGRRTPDLVSALVEEVLPELVRRYGASSRREHVAILANFYAGAVALEGGLEKGPAIGNVALLSHHPRSQLLEGNIARIATRQDPASRWFVSWSSAAAGNRDGTTASVGAKLSEALEAAGIVPLGGEQPGSEGWTNWRRGVGEALLTFWGDRSPGTR